MAVNKYQGTQDVVDRLYGLIEEQKGFFQLKTTSTYSKLVAQYFERVAQAKQEGKLLVAHTVHIPHELLHAMDMVPLITEVFTQQILNLYEEDAQKYLNISVEMGMSPEMCSFFRVLYPMVAQGDYPLIDAYIYSNMLCDNTTRSGPFVADKLKIPVYYMERPYRLDITQSRKADYYRQEVEGMVNFLEELSGRKMDYDRLREVVSHSYRSTEIIQEILDLRKAVPSPMPSEGASVTSTVDHMLSGLPEAVHYLEQVRDEMKDRVAKGIGAIPTERFRIIYPLVLPYFDMELMPLIEQRYGAVAVASQVPLWVGEGKWLVDPSDPVGNLSRKPSFMNTTMFNATLEEAVENVVQMARDYLADGAITFADIGCRQNCGYIRVLKDELESQLGIPMVSIDCNLNDKSFNSREEVLDRLDGFFEILEDRK